MASLIAGVEVHLWQRCCNATLMNTTLRYAPLFTAPTNCAACACTDRSCWANCASNSAGFGILLCLQRAGSLTIRLLSQVCGLSQVKLAEPYEKRCYGTFLYLLYRKLLQCMIKPGQERQYGCAQVHPDIDTSRIASAVLRGSAEWPL